MGELIKNARIDARKVVLNGGDYTESQRRLAWLILVKHGVNNDITRNANAAS